MPPKKTRKRKLQQALQLDGLVNLGGESASGATEAFSSSLDDCLNALEQQQQPTTKNATKESETTDAPKSLPSPPPSSSSSYSPYRLCSSIGTPCRSLHALQATRRSEWTVNLRLWQETGRYTPGLLPSFELELSRHFQVQVLSQYVLDQCPLLRMPAFERWLVDAKVEEQRQQQQQSSTTARPNDNNDNRPKMSKSQRREFRRRQKQQKSGGGFLSDPILASQPWNLAATRRLEQEMQHSLLSSNDSDKTVDAATRVARELCRRTSAAVQELVQKQRQSLDHVPLQKGDRIVLEKDGPKPPENAKSNNNNTPAFVTLYYHRKRWKQPFRVKLNQAHYEKLLRAFEETHGLIIGAQATSATTRHTNKNKRAAIHVFHLIVMSLTLRYSSLSGGQLLNDLRGGGMQGAIHEDVFYVLYEEATKRRASGASTQEVVLLEGFASPFNYACSNYASAFSRDLDFHFGSLGSFQDMVRVLLQHNNKDKENPNIVCELNPPFAPAFMEEMVETLAHWLEAAESRQACLSLFVVVPTVSTTDAKAARMQKQWAQSSFQKMTQSSFCTQNICLEARDHGYVEGAQHLRRTRHKESQYDTSVIVLQTTRARLLLMKSSLEARIRQAFADKHKSETAAAASRRKVE